MNCAPKSNAERQRQLRIRRRYEASGEAWLFTQCRECGTSIRPSFCRGFCPGGKCRKLFSRRVQVPRVCRLTLLDQNLSTAVLDIDSPQPINPLLAQTPTRAGLRFPLRPAWETFIL